MSMMPVKNILANLIGSGWVVLMRLLFTPVYIHFLGVEGYGLVGFAFMVQAVANILDLGLSKTCNRELARLSCSADFADHAAITLRTFEVVYWGMAVLLGAVIVLSAPLIASDWISYEKLSEGEVRRALILMGLQLALQWPGSMYKGGFFGLEKHVLLNKIIIATSAFKHIGTSLTLGLFSSSISIFFMCYAMASLVEAFLLATVLWRLLRKHGSVGQPRFSVSDLKKIWHFSASISGTQLLSVGITQIDKIVLSKLVPLEWFGYYMLASVAAASLGFLVRPFSTALFPRFSKLVKSDVSQFELYSLYHQSCQWVAAFIIPVALVIALYPEPLLFLWTHNAIVANHAAAFLSLLIVASALNALMTIPYVMQLAYGWASLAMYYNAVSLALQVPLLIVCVESFGIIGAAMPRILHNLGYVIILMPLMHKRILKGELINWYWSGLCKPFLIISACLGFIDAMGNISSNDSTNYIIIFSSLLIGIGIGIMNAKG
ncbi:hypothetical protein D6779_09040 [Candidatus Parcubacteria bacterium]|nr:MAG: hypothetical protein D6779_09040 [Candidatus Parcubacteria bacterium]